MSAKKQLVEEFVRSFENDIDDWIFGIHTADNDKCGIRLWIKHGRSMLSIVTPTDVRFNLFDRIKIYKAMNTCRPLKIIKLKNQ